MASIIVWAVSVNFLALAEIAMDKRMYTQTYMYMLAVLILHTHACILHCTGSLRVREASHLE